MLLKNSWIFLSMIKPTKINYSRLVMFGDLYLTLVTFTWPWWPYPIPGDLYLTLVTFTRSLVTFTRSLVTFTWPWWPLPDPGDLYPIPGDLLSDLWWPFIWPRLIWIWPWWPWPLPNLNDHLSDLCNPENDPMTSYLPDQIEKYIRVVEVIAFLLRLRRGVVSLVSARVQYIDP